MSTPKEKEFRIEYMFYDGDLQYHIEQYRNGKWRLVAGGYTRSQAVKILENGGGEILVKQMKNLQIFVITLTILAVAFLIIKFIILPALK